MRVQGNAEFTLQSGNQRDTGQRIPSDFVDAPYSGRIRIVGKLKNKPEYLRKLLSLIACHTENLQKFYALTQGADDEIGNTGCAHLPGAVNPGYDRR
jgi:hypothetical protein